MNLVHQIDQVAEITGKSPRTLVEEAGLDGSSYDNWNKGRNNPRRENAQKVLSLLERYKSPTFHVGEFEIQKPVVRRKRMKVTKGPMSPKASPSDLARVLVALYSSAMPRQDKELVKNFILSLL